jgi:glucitol operon activator protein
MAWWQTLLLILVFSWLAVFFVRWRQARHYRSVLSMLALDPSCGFLGVGNARANQGKGVILMVMVAPDLSVRKLMLMEGRSVFASFRSLSGLEGLNLHDLTQHEAFGTQEPARQKALQSAMAQINRAHASFSDDAKSAAKTIARKVRDLTQSL